MRRSVPRNSKRRMRSDSLNVVMQSWLCEAYIFAIGSRSWVDLLLDLVSY